MLIYKLGPKKFAPDLQGIGAKLYGGRWNHIDTACIYTSANKSLSMLEYSVHLKLATFKPDLVFTTYEVDPSHFHKIDVSDLPIGWDSIPTLKSTKDIASNHFKDNPESLGLIVPSIIIPDELNFLLNPLSSKFPEVKVLSVIDHHYDKRIKM